MSAPATARKAYKIREAADLYGVHADTIRKAINSGELRAKKIGKQYALHADALAEWWEALPNG